MFKSLRCPWCVYDVYIASVGKGIKYVEDAVKAMNVQDLEDFSEELWSV